MLAGHFGLAAAVKSREPQLPVWSLMLCTQLLDVFFVVLYLMGIESFEPVPGTNGGYGNTIIHANYTHSLVGALALSVLAMLVAMIPWGRRNGLILGAMVFSHWILDLIVHHPDMPILPGNAGNLPLLGFGLWSIPWFSFLAELILILAGAYLYYHAAMRTAVRAERQDLKEGPTPKAPYRQQSLTASIVMAVLLVATLLGDQGIVLTHNIPGTSRANDTGARNSARRSMNGSEAMMKVKDVMTKDPETVGPGAYIGDVAKLMRDLDVGIIPVVSNDELKGVITDRDITIRVTAAGLNPFEVTVQDFTSPNPISVSPDDDVEKARELMSNEQIRRLLVTEGNKLVGIISLGDLATKDRAEDTATGEVLENISEPTNFNTQA